MLVKTFAFPFDVRRRLQTQVHRGRLQGTQHLLGDQLVHRRRFQAEARLFAFFEEMSVAPVVRLFRLLRMVADVHAMPTAAANDQAAEQRPPCASRAFESSETSGSR